VIKIASKKNKNNPNNKSNGVNGSNNGSGNIKQNKLISSEYCEKNCKNVNECQKYKDYMDRMVGRACYGIRCSK